MRPSRPKQWTEAEVRFLKTLARRKIRAEEIARELGRHVGSVKKKARELRLLLSKTAKEKSLDRHGGE
jgi:hypothetical protein